METIQFVSDLLVEVSKFQHQRKLSSKYSISLVNSLNSIPFSWWEEYFLLNDVLLAELLYINISRKEQYKFLFLSFRRVLNVIYSFLGNSPSSEF